ncbi:hypothetical protein EBB79_17840 [Parasedimentitalea marina]|uniref:Uncharacterized protein n=1 Tax=Parasedimentitalea marina TaxID=2483033 RepID=A0A3T0N690_9RHOB|nr:hypothetical protein [Parasedimentitalea marina]AZV79550.1 hypothetical protein EBB79_17840 [Parasedimentitalea marina]
MTRLNNRLLAAHAAGDTPALVALYTEAADTAASQDAMGFYLTQAYIYALDAGHGSATVLHSRLVEMGRDN